MAQRCSIIAQRLLDPPASRFHLVNYGNWIADAAVLELPKANEARIPASSASARNRPHPPSTGLHPAGSAAADPRQRRW
jgi:hypothetical protein